LHFNRLEAAPPPATPGAAIEFPAENKMNTNKILWMVLLSFSTIPCLAVNKCVERSGRIFYQDAPCPADTYGGDMSLNVNRPFTGQAAPPVTVERAISPVNSAALTTPTMPDEGTIPPIDATEQSETATTEPGNSMDDPEKSDASLAEDSKDVAKQGAEKLHTGPKPHPKTPLSKRADRPEATDQDLMESPRSRLETIQHDASR
jgi:hypothetical protein